MAFQRISTYRGVSGIVVVGKDNEVVRTNMEVRAFARDAYLRPVSFQILFLPPLAQPHSHFLPLYFELWRYPVPSCVSLAHPRTRMSPRRRKPRPPWLRTCTA